MTSHTVLGMRLAGALAVLFWCDRLKVSWIHASSVRAVIASRTGKIIRMTQVIEL
jgi:hypothetical protein